MIGDDAAGDRFGQVITAITSICVATFVATAATFADVSATFVAAMSSGVDSFESEIGTAGAFVDSFESAGAPRARGKIPDFSGHRQYRMDIRYMAGGPCHP